MPIHTKPSLLDLEHAIDETTAMYIKFHPTGLCIHHYIIMALFPCGHAVPQLTIPVKRSLVYDLRERIYHNKEKVMSRVDVPLFTRLPLSSEPSDRKLFPQTVVQSNQIVSLEVTDPVLNVKLRQYYSRSRYTGNAVESISVTGDPCLLTFSLHAGVTSA